MHTNQNGILRMILCTESKIITDLEENIALCTVISVYEHMVSLKDKNKTKHIPTDAHCSVLLPGKLSLICAIGNLLLRKNFIFSNITKWGFYCEMSRIQNCMALQQNKLNAHIFIPIGCRLHNKWS